MKKNKIKKISIPLLLFSFFFSCVFFLDTKLIFQGEEIGPFTNVFWGSFTTIDLFWFFFFFCFSYFAVKNLGKWLDKIPVQEKQKKRLPIFKISFVVLLLAWLPYLLTYFPGGIFYDTLTSIRQVEESFQGLSNHHPILYTLMLKFFTSIGKSLHIGIQGGLTLFLLMQYIFCAFVLSYAVKVIYKKVISKWYAYGSLFFFSFFSLVPFYVITIWKDTLFSFTLFLFITFLMDKGYAFLEEKKDILKYIVLCFFLCFLRNNAIFLVFATTLFLFIKTKHKSFLITNGIFLFSVLLVQGPVYSYFHWNGDAFVEASAIPFQQIAYSVREGVELEEKEVAFLKSVIPFGTLKGSYTSVNFDTLKFHEEFNRYAFSKGKKEFILLWFKLLPKNFSNYIEAYLLQTLGFWDFLRSNDTGYIQNTVWENEYGLQQVDLFEKVSGFSLKKVLEPKVYVSSASFVWIAFFSFALVLQKKKYTSLLYFLPCLFLWLSIMMTTPIAFSLRYVYIFVLFVPFSVILPLLPNEK